MLGGIDSGAAIEHVLNDRTQILVGTIEAESLRWHRIQSVNGIVNHRIQAFLHSWRPFSGIAFAYLGCTRRAGAVAGKA